MIISRYKQIPVIDLFAGPGGLGEGFSSFRQGNKSVFKIKLSIEKDPIAHQTLLLRSFFRQFDGNSVPEDYYQYVKGKIAKDELFQKHPKQAHEAQKEAQCAELGSPDFPDGHIDVLISAALKSSHGRNWLLIGGPPCQAYSLVGRSKMKGMKGQKEFEKDHRHFLYREYLRIIAKHRPSVFVMENVKGLLSATINGENIFYKILEDLKNPCTAFASKKETTVSYKLYSLASPVLYSELPEATDFIIESEKFGIPQARHRVIILGVRFDISERPELLNSVKEMIPMWDVLCDLPKVRSRLSDEIDSLEKWREAIASMSDLSWFKNYADNILKKTMKEKLTKLQKYNLSDGDNYISCQRRPREYADWYLDHRLSGICSHIAKSHMREDLHRYFFAACYAKVYKRSPRMGDFPKELLPKHANIDDAVNGKMFSDRFKVQLSGTPASTITSHISKDGHYFIHPDPCQCRSLTVREAARLQTFPDNYNFEGNRTSQYQQVGNAVPPLLARNIAEVVYKLFQDSKKA